jgi:DNA (cytosine-5)-methyltransferase 1
MKQIESTEVPITHGIMPVLNNVLNAGSFRHGSLFSGIGGFDLAAQWMGWENVFHCEWNEFGKKVLNYYWPQAISYDDITKTDFTPHRGTIDVLSGGFPCQPYSSAGKRLGKEDDRHLWPEMLRAIREIKPTWVVGENVYGLVNWNDGLVFHEVQTDLEAEGYTVQPCVIPACAVNAPHRRDRIWFIAYASHERCIDGSDNWEERHLQAFEKRKFQESEPKRNGWEFGISPIGEISTEPNTDTPIQQSECLQSKQREIGKQEKRQSGRNDSKMDSSSGRWSRWPTESPICGRNDGLSERLAGITLSKHRSESLKAYGNAVVPQVVYQIFKTIQEYEGVS